MRLSEIKVHPTDGEIHAIRLKKKLGGMTYTKIKAKGIVDWAVTIINNIQWAKEMEEKEDNDSLLIFLERQFPEKIANFGKELLN